MPKRYADEHLSPADRRRELASLLAKAVVRWHRMARTAGKLDAQKSSPGREIGLELLRETRLSVGGTRGLSLRNDGDEE
jgi:hypothetical protein